MRYLISFMFFRSTLELRDEAGGGRGALGDVWGAYNPLSLSTLPCLLCLLCLQSPTPPLPPYLLSSALPCFALQQCVWCLEAPSVWFAVSRLHTMFLLQTPQLRPGHLTAGGRPANYAGGRILLIIWSPSKHPRYRFGPCMVSALLQIGLQRFGLISQISIFFILDFRWQRSQIILQQSELFGSFAPDGKLFDKIGKKQYEEKFCLPNSSVEIIPPKDFPKLGTWEAVSGWF